ncbi:N-arachidonyl glycine receptor [Biomphalaria pfeifferi]|uniref:N-arachidonyl glycine receptor n=1 Tax=Biomphalaria pfeifferi TaxID=112525 RepID=A0AAD8EUR7_BIOPF|nr:N-arachidonyl glycine receptor [Biomphalaria pfeifferi]
MRIMEDEFKLTTPDTDLSERDKLLVDIDRALKIYYSIALVTVGTVLNILSIVILSRVAFRNSTTSVYLRYLACIDMFVLYNGLSRHFVSGISGYNIRYLSEAFCKFNLWSSAFAPDISAWILVVVTTERLMSIVLPHRVRTVCSKSTAAAAVIVITLIIMASNLPVLFFFGDQQVPEDETNSTVTLRCVILTNYETFMNKVWYWLDLLKFVLLPSSILTIFNIIIIIYVIRSRRRVEKVVATKTFRGRPNSMTLTILKGSRHAQLTSGHPGFTTTTVPNNCVIGSNKEISLTITLLVINATFVICNTPIVVYFLASQYWFPPGLQPAERLTLTASIMAMYTNNAVNFLLYCATGSRFRVEIRHLCSDLRNAGSSWAASSRLVKNNNTSNEVLKSNHLDDQMVSVMGSMESFYTYQ